MIYQQNDYNVKFGGGDSNLLISPAPNNNTAAVTNNTISPISQKPIASTTKKYNVAPKRTIPRGTNYTSGYSKSTELKGKVENPTAKSIDIVFYKDKFAFEEKSFNNNCFMGLR